MAANNDHVRVEIDARVLRRRMRRLEKNVKSKKSRELWPALASKMAAIYERMYSQNWPHVRGNTSAYQKWKEHWGFPKRKLEMTGRLKEHLTSSSSIVDGSNTNENMLTIGVDDVSTSHTGPGLGAGEREVTDSDFFFNADVDEDDESFIEKSIGVGWFRSTPHKLAPFNYPEALARGFSGGTAWGAAGQRFSVSAMGNFLWTANFIKEVEVEVANFFYRQAVKVWGSNQVRKRFSRR